jgi:hypothetical protein
MRNELPKTGETNYRPASPLDTGWEYSRTCFRKEFTTG